MRLAVVQNDPTFGAKNANIADCIAAMETNPADLYVLPELFACGYNFVTRDEVQDLAEPFEGGITHRTLTQFAKQHQCSVVYGFVEQDGDRLYNSAGFVGPSGSLGLYRKIHLFDREKLFFAPGNLEFPVIETPQGRVGVMICFDWYFPESARTLTLKGAQIIAHPANLVLPNCPDGMRTRCLENRVFAATANRIGVEDRGGHRLTYIGQSQITSCRGEILHRCAADSASVAVQELDPCRADDKNLNSHNHLLSDRRKEFYL